MVIVLQVKIVEKLYNIYGQNKIQMVSLPISLEFHIKYSMNKVN